jgi:hypothetical protein
MANDRKEVISTLKGTVSLIVEWTKSGLIGWAPGKDIIY